MISKAFTVLKEHYKLGVVFSLAKATVYFTPLLLADVLTKTDFGILEYALAGLGMIVNTIINIGVPGAYPYFILKQKKLELANAFKLHPIILIIPFLINQILFYGFNFNINYYMAFNMSFIIANQVFYSTQLKSHERSVLAVIIDSGIYILLLVYYLLLKLSGLTANIDSLNITIQLYSFYYVLYGILVFYKVDKNELFEKYKNILRYSIHLLLSTFLIFLITTSGRILVELFFDFETVGIYAFYFRLAAVVVMIHQIVNIAYFKKIYTLDPKILDKYYFLFFILIFFLSIFTYIALPLIASHISNFFVGTYTENKQVYFLLSVQMVMWIATALNSSIIDRENLTSKNNPKFLILIVFSAIVLFFIKNRMSLQLLTFIHLTVIFLASLIQYHSLYRAKIYFKKSFLTLLIVYTLSTYYFINVLK